MNRVDWTIVGGLLIFITGVALFTKKYTRSVVDFLAASRCAGPYLLAVSEGVAMSGAVAYIALFEMMYKAGFTAFWWQMMTMPLSIFVALTGWVIYRFRQTRCMTLAQFLEIRYSKKFRVFMGILGFVSGVLNFGIFPAVAARFFLYFCGLPQTVSLLGFEVSTFVILMFFLIAVSLFFTFIGGQIVVLVTDFFQGQFTNIAGIIVLVVLFQFISWDQIVVALKTAPDNSSLLHPLHTAKTEDFDYWFFVIVAFTTFYSTMAWQGTQGYNCSARSPHAARMGRILGTWRSLMMWLICLMVPIFALTIMNNPDFSDFGIKAQGILSRIDNPKIQEQMATPVILRTILPNGIMGIMAAMMMVSFIANFDTYLHSWGSIFIQDVILPFRKKPFERKTHLMLLRLSILGVAVFVFLFSILFTQTDYILMFMAVTGSIYLAGAGAVIIGGLYWKQGNSFAAWAAAILGLVLSMAGLVAHQIFDNFPLNGQWIMFISMLSSATTYILISLLVKRSPFNLDRMLHKGKYSLEGTKEVPEKSKDPKWRVLAQRLGIDKDFNGSEKLVYVVTIGIVLGLFIMTVVGTIINFFIDFNEDVWASFWHGFLWFGFGFIVIVTGWFLIGGSINIIQLYYELKTTERNDLDSGMVVDHHNIDEKIESQ